MPAEKHRRSSSGENTPVVVVKKRRISGSPLLTTPALVLEQLQNVSVKNNSKSPLYFHHTFIITHGMSAVHGAVCVGVDSSSSCCAALVCVVGCAGLYVLTSCNLIVDTRTTRTRTSHVYVLLNT